MRYPRLAGLLLLWVITTCPLICAGGAILRCCNDGACTEKDGESPAPASPCFCSGALLPVSEHSAVPTLALDAWVQPREVLDQVAPSTSPFLDHPSWGAGPPAGQGIGPLLI